MEFMQFGGKLKTLITWHTMKERPEESGNYLAIWHTQTDHYEVIEMAYSKKYDCWGAYDNWNAEKLVDHMTNGVCITEKSLVGWYSQNFDECFKKDGEF